MGNRGGLDLNRSLEPARRDLAAAARALDEFRRLSGAPQAEAALPSGWRVPAETGARAALDEARARLADVSAELDRVRRAAAAEADAAAAERLEAAHALEEAAALRAHAAALEGESAAARDALEEAAARARRVEDRAREGEAAWAARLETARAEARRELAEEKSRAASLQSELEAACGEAATLAARAAERREAAESREATRADARSDVDALQRRAAEASGRVSLLEAECVRLEKLRHAADQATAEAEAQGRDVAEVLRREVRALHAALDRAAVDAGAGEAKTRAEADALRARLEAAASRLQALERERRLEQARGAGDYAATQTELLRAQAVAATLRLELNGVRTAAERQEESLRRELSEGRAALDAARRALAERAPPPAP